MAGVWVFSVTTLYEIIDFVAFLKKGHISFIEPLGNSDVFFMEIIVAHNSKRAE